MIFSILAFLALLVSICIKNRKKSLLVQALNCFFEATYNFIICAYTGAYLSIINIIRTCIFINKDKFNKIAYLLILLPTIGPLIRTYCLWQSNMKLVRFSGITTGLLYGLYYIYYKSWFMALGDLVLLIVAIFSIYNNDIKLKDKNNIFIKENNI